MQLIVYILVYPLIWIISILPFRLLYIISDAIYGLLYYVIGYRKKLVLENLKTVFPEKDEKELLKIRKQFFHHFVDIFMEMIKTFTISKKSLNKHYKYKNVELLNELYEQDRDLILVGAHYANWEWIVGLSMFLKHESIAAFTLVNNKYFNKKVKSSRERFGAKFVKTSETINKIEKNNRNNIRSIYGLLSDQSPQLKKTHYWSNFFDVHVPIHTGAEMLAKKYNMCIVYINTQKIKRGYYETTFELMTNDANSYNNYELTELFLRKVEKIVKEKPAYYFWTHNRFKHRNKYDEYLKLKKKNK